MNYAEKIVRQCILGLLIACCISGCLKNNIPWSIQRDLNLQNDLLFISENSPMSLPKLSLEDIIEIALSQNYDLAVKMKEIEVQTQFCIRDQLKMIGQLIVEGEKSHRNNDLIVSSVSVDPAIPPAPPSISTQKHVKRNSVNLVLNVLDFGLAYLKAREESERVRMMVMELNRTRQTLVLEITKQYWKAVASKVAIEGAVDILDKAMIFQNKVSSQISDRIISPTRGLKGISDLINLEIQLNSFRNEYAQAIAELTVMMGLPSADFELAYADERSEEPCLDDITTLEDIALKNRPDLFARDVEQQIAVEEARYAFLQMLPGAELFIGNYYDANKFFENNYWVIAGARAAWNLFSIPWHYFDTKAYGKRQELIQLQRISLTIGVLAQVRLAYILTHENFAQYSKSRELERTNERLYRISSQELELGATSSSDLLFIESQTLFAKVNALKAYGDFQIALEQLKYSIGAPRHFKTEHHTCTVNP